MNGRAFIAIAWLCLSAGCAAPKPKLERPARDPQAVHAVLDGFHSAAARADEAGYFGYFAQEAVFLGTDATERWSREQFRTYAHPHFSKGKGWTYLPQERQLTFSVQGDVVWFDELLTHDKYGVLRGTGVLVREAGKWKIAQYNLTFTIPNEVAGEVVRVVQTKPAP